jgi:hypothetical protein
MKGDGRRPGRISIRSSVRQLEARIRELSHDSSNILWSNHARDRMDERGIYADDALRILRFGHARGSPEKTDRGEWKLKMVKAIKGAREAGVVTIVLTNGRLLIVTVEWEDIR